MGNLISTFIAIVIGILLYRFRAPILGAFRRFDAANRARIDEQARETQDSLAHFRHTLALAEEQVEAVHEITVPDPLRGTPVKRFVFEGEQFLDRGDAERMRAEKVRTIARGFYRELPLALSARGDGKLGRD